MADWMRIGTAAERLGISRTRMRGVVDQAMADGGWVEMSGQRHRLRVKLAPGGTQRQLFAEDVEAIRSSWLNPGSDPAAGQRS